MTVPDARMAALNAFTSTTHGPAIPENLRSQDRLGRNFTVLILGAGEGIGEHIAYAYAAAGASTIVLTARRLANLELVKNRILTSCCENELATVRVEVATVDISSSNSMQDLATFVKSKVSKLDCVILNAAYAPPVLLKTHLDQPKDVQQAFDVNAMGTFHAAHYFVPILLEATQGAKQFIAISSMAGCIRRGHIANMGYCVSKMAQARMIEYIFEQYADQGLFTVAVHPGAVDTSMAKGNTPETFLKYLVDDIRLCSAWCVWLSKTLEKDVEKVHWLNGRFTSATWDVDELLAKRRLIEDKDLLKFAMAL